LLRLDNVARMAVSSDMREPPPTISPTLNVQDFGALGEEVNNEGPAIQAAIDQARISGSFNEEHVNNPSLIPLKNPYRRSSVSTNRGKFLDTRSQVLCVFITET
jgi:hypothetical protein